jgi:RecJ-like exonuclease
MRGCEPGYTHDMTPAGPDDTVLGDQVSHDTKAGGPTVCPDCGGTGRVGAERCEACDGTGNVEEPVGGAGYGNSA